MAQVAKKPTLLLRGPAVAPRTGASLVRTGRDTTGAPKTATLGWLTHDDSGAIERWDRKWFCCATLCLVALVVVALWVVVYTLRGPQKRLTSTPLPEAFRGRVVPETVAPVPVRPDSDDNANDVEASDGSSSPRQPDDSYGDTIGDEGGFNITDAVGTTSDEYEWT
ncbi:hypothetical protein V5799_011415 [Amblyomma americanum]|uniref:Uncharacterized protein n=1 Tax=Amblyomma americanum TaxID=6943 RepID=A0AAQ4EH62_AMBAM